MNDRDIYNNRYYLFKNSNHDIIACVDVMNWPRIIRFGDEEALSILSRSYYIVPISEEEMLTYCDAFDMAVLYSIFDLAVCCYGTMYNHDSFEPWYWEFDELNERS